MKLMENEQTFKCLIVLFPSLVLVSMFVPDMPFIKQASPLSGTNASLPPNENNEASYLHTIAKRQHF